MSVTNYTPNIDRGCTYNYSKLKDVVYLVSADHVKDVHIDNGYAYIDGLSELPLRINGFNIQFTESESLDERYRFEKKLTLSMHGYVNVNFFDDKFYAIIETTDGTFYMINVDFPSRVTYTFNLGGDTSQTDFTFASQSNIPTLKLASNIGNSESICRDYNVNGIESLELIECNHVVINDSASTVDIYGVDYDFRKIEYIGKSCTLQETFDGDKVTDTIKFEIGFDSYKTSWHYNLLEFLENTYTAIIGEKGDSTHQYNVGFGTCLQPSFEINSSTQQGDSDKITVTLSGSSERGLTKTLIYNRVYHTETYWKYIKRFGNLKLYTCVDGVAQYLVKREVDGLGNPTGNYKVYTGLTSFYSNYFNVVGEFDDVVTFESNECSEADGCILTTDMPSTIYFSDVSCKSYSLRAECNWSVYDLPEYITVTPSSGVANTSYTLLVCNTETPTDTLLEDTFMLRWGNNEIVENVKVGTDYGFIRPTVAYINCLAQNVIFKFNENCKITITSIDPSLSYNIGYGKLTITVPFNSSTSARTWSIEVENCSEDTQTISIVQDQMYTRWATVSGYLCSGDTSYTKEAMFSGATSSNINTMTSAERMGTKIKDVDSRCAQEQSKFEFFEHYYCIDGDKYKALEEVISYDGGITWDYKSGVSRLGELVESDSPWCEIEPEYKWVLRENKFQCGDNE